MAKGKLITTDKDIDAALARAAEWKDDVRVVSATYHAGAALDLIVLCFEDGRRQAIPREDIQGLQAATRKQISELQLIGGGTGLYWPALDFGLYVPSLRKGILGDRRWMAALRRKNKEALIPAA